MSIGHTIVIPAEVEQWWSGDGPDCAEFRREIYALARRIAKMGIAVRILSHTGETHDTIQPQSA